MEKVLEFSGIIHSKYPSEARFADSLGWTRQRLNKITNGKREPTLNEVAQMASGLGMSLEEVAQIFLRHGHQMGNIN